MPYLLKYQLIFNPTYNLDFKFVEYYTLATIKHISNIDILLISKMKAKPIVNFAKKIVHNKPFSHFIIPDCLELTFGLSLLEWFETEAPWWQNNKVFYESFGIDFFDINMHIPTEFKILKSDDLLKIIKKHLEKTFNTNLSETFHLSAHKLIPGYRIGIHTDFGEYDYTHRFLIQLNRGWRLEYGGILMLFDEEYPSNISSSYRYYLPQPFSAVGFEISPISFHAVSEVMTGERYTLCFSFKKKE